MVNGEKPECWKKSAAKLGSSENPKKALKMAAPRRIKKIIAVVCPVLIRASKNPWRRIFPLVMAMINAPTAPTPAPSVGVNMPA